MNKEFIPYEEALALKELGFDKVSCMGVYYNVTNVEDIDIDCEEHFSPCNYETQYYANKGYKDAVLAPLYQQAFRWFREKYDLHPNVTNDKFGYYAIGGKFNTYEEAELSCLRKLIEIVKDEDKKR